MCSSDPHGKMLEENNLKIFCDLLMPGDEPNPVMMWSLYRPAKIGKPECSVNEKLYKVEVSTVGE